MTLPERILWPLAGVGLALVLAWNPFFDRLDHSWQDFTLRHIAPDREAGASLVLDIDEPSLNQLRPQHGHWPLSRELHAKVAQRLLDAGADAVVFNIVFNDERAGDLALKDLAERSGRVIFGAAAAPAGDESPDWQRMRHWQEARAPATRIEGFRGPAASLLPSSAQARVGMLTLPIDTDGQLRCLLLLSRMGPQLLPALPLAAALATAPHAMQAVAAGAGWLSIGAQRWPVNAEGCLALTLLARADAVPTLAFAALTGDADPALALSLPAQVRGRTVFVGSPSLMDARVMTPLGQVGGTRWMALAFESLRTGGWIAAPTLSWTALLWALALLPALLGAMRAAPDLRKDSIAAAAALAALFALAWGLAVLAKQQSALPMALLLLACTTLAGGWRWQRWLAQERAQAQMAQAAAEAANRAKTDFLSHMSHEIRTPLNAVLGMAQLLAETPLTPLQRGYVEVFGSAGRHLGQLIEDVLDLSRVEAGSLQLASLPFAPSALAAELRALFASRAHALSLQYRVEVDPALPAWLVGDNHRLRQILVNLVGNALKFTRQGEVALELSPDEGGAGLCIVVKDTGVGVPADKLDSIFEPFVQADGAIVREHGGSGLGLAITRRLVLAMGGTIAMRSEPGSGTVITLRLPLAACEAPQREAQAPALDAQARPRWPGRRVLLAEDHPHNVLVVQGMLADTGILIDLAPDGRSAVAMAASQHYDLVLMDVQMPLLDGHGATRQIRRAEQAAKRRATPILTLSANAMVSDHQASLDAGCDGHLAKPLSKSDLLAALWAQLGAPDASPPGLIDTATAIARLGGSRELYAKVCDSARAQLSVWGSAFDAALAAGDELSCRRLAHDLKSVAGTLGAAALADTAQALELQCVEAGLPTAALLQTTRGAVLELLQVLESDPA